MRGNRVILEGETLFNNVVFYIYVYLIRDMLVILGKVQTFYKWPNLTENKNILA